jgi:hypothetical protein
MSDGSKGFNGVLVGCFVPIAVAIIGGIFIVIGALIESGAFSPQRDPTPTPYFQPTPQPSQSQHNIVLPTPTPPPVGPPADSIRANGKWDSHVTLRENTCGLALAPSDSGGYYLWEVTSQDGIISNFEAVVLNDGMDRYLATSTLNWPVVRFQYNLPNGYAVVTLRFSGHESGTSQWEFHYLTAWGECVAIYRDF